MEFLKNLSLSDDDRKKQQEEEQKKTQPTPPPVEARKDNIFDKIGDAFDGRKTPPPTTVATEAQHETVQPANTSSFLHTLAGVVNPPAAPAAIVAKPVPEHEHHNSFLAKLTGNDEHVSAPVPVAVPKDESLFGRISEAINPTPAPAPPPAPVHEPGVMDKLFGSSHAAEVQKPAAPNAQESLLERMGSHLSGRKTPPPVAVKEDEGFFARLTGGKTPPPQPENKNLLEKFGDQITGKKTPPPPATGVGARVNALLGGGHKSEKNEDGLDKALDFVQEHILKQGSQHDESFWQQQTDEQITDAIRRQYKNMTGNDFPVKDRK